MAPPRRSTFPTVRDAGNLLAAAALLGFYLVIGSASLDHGRDQDFLNLYAAASLARDGNFHHLHEPAVQLMRERQIVPARTVLVPFVRPHAYAAALAPLAFLSHGAAFRVWIALQLGLLMGFLALVWRDFGSEGVAAASMFAPGVIGIVHGQDNMVMAIAAMAGLSALTRGRELRGGLWWSLILVKFHLAAGFGLALLAARRWRALGGFIAGGTALASASLALGGWQGATGYIDLLTRPTTEGLYPGYDTLANLQGLAANLRVPVAGVYGTVGVAVAAILMTSFRRNEWWRKLSLAVGGAVILAPHIYIYDLTILLPALLLSIRQARARRVRLLALLVLCPLTVMGYLALAPLRLLLVPTLLAWLWAVSKDETLSPAATPRDHILSAPA